MTIRLEPITIRVGGHRYWGWRPSLIIRVGGHRYLVPFSLGSVLVSRFQMSAIGRAAMRTISGVEHVPEAEN